MAWYKASKNNINENDLNKIVKKTLKTHKFFSSLMDFYGISSDDIDNHLTIKVKELDGKYAQGNGNEIHLNEKLFNENNLEENFHYIVHEFFHWLKRRSEDKFYFNDPEEVQSFVMAMAWELIRGKTIQDIKRLFSPIVFKYFNNKGLAEKIFKRMLNQALFVKKTYSKND